MKAIIAVNNLGFIGKAGKLPWRCVEDLKHFREKTKGCLCVVGYRTRRMLPKLSDRALVEDDRYVHLEHTENDWCIGGKKTYEKYCHLFTEIHISHIDDNTIGDVMFPDLSKLNPDCKIFNYHYNLQKSPSSLPDNSNSHKQEDENPCPYDRKTPD